MINGETYDDYIGECRLDICACGEAVRPSEEHCPECADLLAGLVVAVEDGIDDEND